MCRDDWLKVIGREWSGFDNISVYKKQLKRLLPVICIEMMSQQEIDLFSNLGRTTTIYRGCGAAGIDGVCWTLDKAIAKKFTSFNRYEVEDPIIVTARIRKENIVAVKLDREEQEIICFNPNIIKIESNPIQSSPC